MDKKRATEILRRARPWLPLDEPDRAEENQAREFAEADPALARFGQQQEKFNERVHQELTAIPIPAGLRDQILAHGKIVRAPFWTRPGPMLALAAALLLLAVGLFSWTRPREDLSIAGFQSRMTGFALREYSMDLLTRDMTQLKSFLSAKGGPAEFNLPPRLAQTPLKGGARLSWQGKPVSMVCFEWKSRETLYMFVLDEALPTPAQPSATPTVKPLKGLSTATWTANGLTFLLAGHVPESTLIDLTRS